ncbi:MAG TPA: response regulator [Candidatus Udaeobacter sp.]|nr:response regulator [Candidatus Udaeobacter sp.]
MVPHGTSEADHISLRALGARRRSDSPTVLVADDDAGLRAATRVALAAQGWTVFEAASPEECLALAREHRPDVLLLDVNFEGHDRDGFAVCRKLTAERETRSIRVVLLTANDDPENRAFASAVGATAFIVKPFGPADLVRLLRVIREESGDEPRVGLRLVESGSITPSQLEEALGEQRRQAEKSPLGAILVQLGFATEDDVRRALEREQRSTFQRDATSRSRVPLRVVIADDNASVREGLREVISAEADFVLVGVAADGAEALRLITEHRPDLVVLDNEMPQRSGVEVLRAVHDTMPETAIVMFTLDDSIRETALAAGAAAVLPKDTPIDTLLSEIRRHGRAAPQVKVTRSVVLTRRGVGQAWRTLAQRRRAVSVVAILLVFYAGAFLLAEPTLGASASLLAIAIVALGGALLGPEAGVALALLCSIESVVLWQTTNHQIGEPILRIGGNGLGIVALVSVGAGFGAMRLVRGRLDMRARRIGAFAEAALGLTSGLDPNTLGMLAEAVLELVPGDAALIYVSVPGGGLELVGTAGVDKSVLGQRRTAGAIAKAFREARATPLTSLDAMAMEDLGDARAGVAVPLTRPGEPPCGVLAVFANRPVVYGPEQIQSVTGYGSFLAALLRASPAATALSEGLPARP